jgi:hypothetical protein
MTRGKKSFFESLYESFAENFAEHMPPAQAGPAQPFGFVTDIKDWMGELGRNALPRFGVHMLSHAECEHHISARTMCPNRSVAECVSCGKATCLFHGFVNHEATLICEQCTGESASRQRFREKKPPKARARAQEAPRPKYRAPRGPSFDPERVQALLALGLPPQASFADVQSRFRELASKLHPDKFPEPERKAAGERFAKITQAYETLKAKAA